MLGQQAETIEGGNGWQTLSEPQLPSGVVCCFAVDDGTGFPPVRSKYLEGLARSVLGFPGFLKQGGVEGFGVDSLEVARFFDCFLCGDPCRIVGSAVINLIGLVSLSEFGQYLGRFALGKDEGAPELGNGRTQAFEGVVQPPARCRPGRQFPPSSSSQMKTGIISLFA